jgi:hypothetical protein
MLALIADNDAIDACNAISSELGLAELGNLACVSRYFAEALKTESNHVWDAMCTATWKDKVHVAAKAISQRGSPNGAREALKLSLADAKRTELTDEELTSFAWRFRFKESAGPQWQQQDPYWVKQEATTARFSPRRAGCRHGRVKMEGFDLISDFQLHWEWAAADHAIPGRLSTRVLQVIVNGNPVPRYVISRHAPNWGWIMQRCAKLCRLRAAPLLPAGSRKAAARRERGRCVHTAARPPHARTPLPSPILNPPG